MNGGNESSGADRAGGPVATSVPIGWQRCVREGAVFYIRYGCPEALRWLSQFTGFLPECSGPHPSSELQFLVPCCSLLFPCLLSLFALYFWVFVSSHTPYALPFLGKHLTVL